MKLVLIEAARRRAGTAWDSWYDDRDRFSMASVGLLSMASQAREQDEVSIIDEKVTPVPSSLDADVVAISCKTMDASHAYALADELRGRGIKVVLGGVHTSLMPESALEHADAVVVGEGEQVLPQVLDDLERQGSKGTYYAPSPRASLDPLPRQRVELFDHPRYMLHATQTARGCSFDCEFCPTREIFGRGYRTRNAAAVLAEVEHLVALEDKPVFFTENVFGAGDIDFVRELGQGLTARGIRFGVFCDWFMLDEDIVKALEAGGCGLIGINATGRKEDREIDALDWIRRAGIPLWGYFMFGFEEDGPDVFERAIARIRRYELVSASITVLTPFPGTPMGRRLAEEGRIFSHDLDRYDHTHVHFDPKQMTVNQLEEGFEHVCREAGDRLSFAPAARALQHG